MRRLLCVFFSLVVLTVHLQSAERVSIDATAPTTAFPHFWETMFGSGRAALALRESYREDLRAVRDITAFRYVRFHAIFHDELGVYTEDEHGQPVYNFAYVDQIYDGLLKNGIRPLVEISFMPRKLAFNPDALHPFWYKQNVSPPKSIERWDGLIEAFARNLIDRYGVEEVASWYFEVWNEPNIDFWGGVPAQKSYFELYDHTASVLKKVNPALRVGGPATAAAAWVDDFIRHCAAQHVPLDFISSHGYADELVENFLGTDEQIPMEHRVFRAIDKVHRQIKMSAKPGLPLLWTEWNVPGMNELRDTAYVGPALANTIRECDGLTEAMSFWTFSDVFEENGPIAKPFEGHFGLRAAGGINKPSFYDFALLHRLGTQRLPAVSDKIIATRRPDGTLVLALWNLTSPETASGPALTFDLEFVHLTPNASVAMQVVDGEHSNTLAAYRSLGSPLIPTEAQVQRMNKTTALAEPAKLLLKDGRLSLRLQPNALVLLEIPPSQRTGR